ncbi:MAG: hypothetical protein QOE98_2089 [Gaiellaceae bacterium]|nr:hypothetical protein [Gaiellaceae bacterium]
MRRGLAAAIIALAIAPAAGAAEATVTVAPELGSTVAPAATYAEPAQTIIPALSDAGASVTVTSGAATVLRLAVGMPAAARLAAGTYDTATGATISLTPNSCVAGLAGSFTLSHAIPGLRHRPASELYLAATLRCGVEPTATTVKVRLARAGSRTNGIEQAKAFLPVIDGLSTGWSDAQGRAFFAPSSGPRTAFAKKGETYLSQGLDRGRGVLQHLRFANRTLGSDLELWQLAPKKRLSLPSGINTRSWEWGGALSGDWLLFQRGEFDARLKSVRLINLKTRAKRTLIVARGRATGLEPGDLNGDYATFTKCTKHCRAYRYQLSTRKTISPRTPAGSSDYASAVLADGTLYFARSRAGCGKGVQIMRLDPGAAKPVQVARVPSGRDVQKLDATAYAGSRIVLYERYSCNFRVTRRDLVRVVEAPAPPAT